MVLVYVVWFRVFMWHDVVYQDVWYVSWCVGVCLAWGVGW